MTEFNLGSVGASQDEGGMVFNLNNVEEKEMSFELLPKGTYNAVVDTFNFGDSKKGNPMITVCYTITDAEYENRKLFDWMVLKGDGAEFGLTKLKKFLVRVCPDVDLSNFNPQAFSDEGHAIGRECRVMVKIQTQKAGEYKGEKRNNVADILSPENNGAFL